MGSTASIERRIVHAGALVPAQIPYTSLPYFEDMPLLFCLPEASTKGRIGVYFHGNAENIFDAKEFV
jgi:hypothetical protein